MLAIQAPPTTALITPARRDSPRPAAIVRSVSGPRPNTTRVPSGIPITTPDGILTCAATEVVGWSAIAFLPGGVAKEHGLVARSLGRVSAFGGSRNPGMAPCGVH